MTLTCVRLTEDHLPALYEVAKAEEPFAEQLAPTLAHFRASMMGLGGVEGFALLDGDTLVGAVNLTNLIPLVDVMIHWVTLKSVRGRWINREVLSKVFGYIYGDLDLPRVSAFTLPGLTSETELLLTRIGFRLEGVKECSALLPDGYHDVWLFGMLKSRCPWI